MPPWPYDDLIYLSVNSIREYGQQDLTIVIKLLILLRTVLRNAREDKHVDTVTTLLHDLAQGLSKNFESESNRHLLHTRMSAVLDECATHPRNMAIRGLLDNFASVGVT